MDGRRRNYIEARCRNLHGLGTDPKFIDREAIEARRNGVKHKKKIRTERLRNLKGATFTQFDTDKMPRIDDRDGGLGRDRSNSGGEDGDENDGEFGLGSLMRGVQQNLGRYFFRNQEQDGTGEMGQTQTRQNRPGLFGGARGGGGRGLGLKMMGH